MKAWQGDKELHSLGIGVPGTPPQDGRWCGHLVVWLPSSKTLIDTTLYPIDPPAMERLAADDRGALRRSDGRLPLWRD